MTPVSKSSLADFSLIENLPKTTDPSDKVLEAEIVGLQSPPPLLWRRLLSSLFIIVMLVLVGVSLCILGIVLTFTIVGAVVGIPLIILGLGALAAALILPLGRSSIRFRIFR